MVSSKAQISQLESEVSKSTIRRGNGQEGASGQLLLPYIWWPVPGHRQVTRYGQYPAKIGCLSRRGQHRVSALIMEGKQPWLKNYFHSRSWFALDFLPTWFINTFPHNNFNSNIEIFVFNSSRVKGDNSKSDAEVSILMNNNHDIIHFYYSVQCSLKLLTPHDWYSVRWLW